MVADSLCIPFHSIITLPRSIRDQVIHETFIVSHLKENAILGMTVLKKHQCHMDFQKLVVIWARKKLACVDKFGRPVVGRVQVVLGLLLFRWVPYK